MHTVGAPLAARPEGRALAVQPDQVHRPLPRDARDLVLRLRLRRQRAARQEVLRAAHRLEHGPRRRLAGRAHADPRRRESRRARRPTSPPRSRQRLRQDQLRDADPARAASRAGRSRPSATTSPGSSRAPTAACARSIPRPASSASRRAPTTRPTRTAMATLHENTIFTNVALTADGDVWWEGMTDEPPAECHRLAGQGLDAGDRQGDRRQGRASERALHRAGHAMPGASTRPGTIPTACRSARSSSAAAARTTMPLVYQALQLESTASTSARRWARRPPPPPPGQVGKVRRDPMAMLPFCGYNMGDYFRHWLNMQQLQHRRDAAEDLPRELVPQGRRRQVPLARLRREHARAEVDRRPRRRQGQGDRDVFGISPALRGPELGRPGLHARAVRPGDRHRQGRLAEGARAARRAVPAAGATTCRPS